MLGLGLSICRPSGLGLSAFDPLSLSPDLWLSADLGRFQDDAGTTPVTTDADPLGLWQDQSGFSRHWSQSTAGHRPTVRFSIQNGLPVVRWDGVDDRLFGNAAACGLAHNVSGITIVAACSGGATGDNRILFLSTNTSTSARVQMHRGRGSGNGSIGVGGRRLDANSLNEINSPAATITGSTFNVQTVTIDYANSNAYAYLDRVQVASSTSFITDGSTSDTASALAVMGASGGASFFFAGDIGELFGFRRALSAGDQAALESYLRERWGTP